LFGLDSCKPSGTAAVHGYKYCQSKFKNENGKIPKKYRELIAITVGCTTQCPYCIEVHSKAAKAAGATREEMAESAFLAAALRAGGAATHGAMALKFFDGE